MVYSNMRRPTKHNRKTTNSVLTCVCAFFVTSILALFLFELKILSGGSQGTFFLENDLTEITKKASIHLAKDQSFGFFNDIPDHEWNLLRKITSEHENHKFMDQPLTHNPDFDTRNLKYNNSPAAWYQTNYEPNFSCRFERRLGGNGNGDGPKWVCDPHRIVEVSKERKAKNPDTPGCLVYSIGSNGDYSFEVGFQEATNNACEVHIFDMGDYGDGVKAMSDELNLNYHQVGLVKEGNDSVNDKGEKFQSLKTIVKSLGHEDQIIDVFKIDCDKCEWRTFQDWLAPDMPVLQQVLVEVHDAPKVALQFFDTFEENNYVRFHKEPNIQYAGGDCIEYAFLKLDKSFFDKDALGNVR